MKKLVRVGVLCAAVAALALGNVTGAGAGGIPEQGTVIINPDPAEVGATVTISNAADDDSLCEGNDEDVIVNIWVYDLAENFGVIYASAVPDLDGNWSTQVTIPNDDAAIGTWEVEAECWPDEDIQPLAYAPFWYPFTQFEVVGADEPIVPDDDVAPAEEVVTTPRFTG